VAALACLLVGCACTAAPAPRTPPADACGLGAACGPAQQCLETANGWECASFVRDSSGHANPVVIREDNAS
jgi:hypothetical protein